MPARSTRRRSSRVREVASQSSGDEAPAAVDAGASNGNGKTKTTKRAAGAAKSASDDEPKENIFLFWPNLIGA